MTQAKQADKFERAMQEYEAAITGAISRGVSHLELNDDPQVQDAFKRLWAALDAESPTNEV